MAYLMVMVVINVLNICKIIFINFFSKINISPNIPNKVSEQPFVQFKNNGIKFTITLKIQVEHVL